MSVHAPHASLLNKAILLPAVITAVYSRQIYSLQLSRLSDSLRLPLSCEVVSVFLFLPHYVGSSAGSSGSTYSVCSSSSSSPPFSCSIGGPSACEVQSRVLLQLDQLEGTYHKALQILQVWDHVASDLSASRPNPA